MSQRDEKKCGKSTRVKKMAEEIVIDLKKAQPLEPTTKKGA